MGGTPAYIAPEVSAAVVVSATTMVVQFPHWGNVASIDWILCMLQLRQVFECFDHFSEEPMNVRDIPAIIVEGACLDHSVALGLDIIVVIMTAPTPFPRSMPIILWWNHGSMSSTSPWM